ncbi:type II secretory pathway component PulM [Massilia aurea]|uniref:Type II secretory pathway component PulM n=1 Tax=Massilia aurea TaxID=373040 RepID=A0A7X0CFB1_9BURK|nr:GspMb/PilO family protein [Massilia aurea]MBB6135056.1 type II secretory pathway component PulM [Massilia aurea]
MSPKLRDLLVALPARQLNLIVGGVIVIALLLAWTLALRAPLAAYRQHKAALAALEAAGTATPGAAPPSASAAAITPAPTPPEPLALIAAVSHSAAASDVAVLSAAQGAQRTVGGVRLLTVEIVASARYTALLDWIAAIERQQPTVGIHRLTVEAADDTDDRAITLQLVIHDTGTPPP